MPTILIEKLSRGSGLLEQCDAREAGLARGLEINAVSRDPVIPIAIRLSQPLSMRNLRKRAIAILILVVAVAIAWLATAVFYSWADTSLPTVAMLLMYGILAWQLRWWRELKYRIPVATLGGAALPSMLRPATVALSRPSRELFSMHQGFYAVNWALIGAAFFALVILLIAPMNLGDDKQQ